MTRNHCLYGRTSRTSVRPNEVTLKHQTEEKNDKLTDFGVNWVNDFSVRRESVFMDTSLIILFNMDYFPSCRCSTALPCHAVDLIPLTFLLLRMTSSHDIKQIKRSTFVIKR
jgi:hypothetical protein